MSSNIKINSFYPCAEWNSQGLNSIIAAIGAGPVTIEEISDAVYSYVQTVIYTAAYVNPIDAMPIISLISNNVNYLTNNTWCDECCNDTFVSYDKVSNAINGLNYFSQGQLGYINQILGMPCNPKITNVLDLIPALDSLETSLIVDRNLTESEKLPVLLLLSIGRSSLDYWATEVGNPGSAWLPYFTPLAPALYLRPFWLANMIGVITSQYNGNSVLMTNSVQDIAIKGLVGGLTNVTAYAVFKSI